jgi:tRNA 2-thiouridine synthesizing protein A
MLSSPPARRTPTVGAAALSAKRLDLRGLKCPLPVLRTQRELFRLAAGQVLIVEATDPMAAIDIPHLLTQTGDVLERMEREAELLRFTIVRREVVRS